MSMEQWRKIQGKEKVLEEKPVTVPLCAPQIAE
jgi:hypothetical protein